MTKNFYFIYFILTFYCKLKNYVSENNIKKTVFLQCIKRQSRFGSGSKFDPKFPDPDPDPGLEKSPYWTGSGPETMANKKLWFYVPVVAPLIS
jgi:hypothetical protein